jgi:hypothetical protein
MAKKFVPIGIVPKGANRRLFVWTLGKILPAVC